MYNNPGHATHLVLVMVNKINYGKQWQLIAFSLRTQA